MSTAEEFLYRSESMAAPSSSHEVPANATPTQYEGITELLGRVQDFVMPVWPLQDYVAVNPYAGFADRKFSSTRRLLRAVSDCELLMPREYYQRRYSSGSFQQQHIELAILELQEERDSIFHQVNLQDVLQALAASPSSSVASQDAHGVAAKSDRQIRSVSEAIDMTCGSDWTAALRDEVGKFCASHYDEGQAAWRSPWKHLPLYQAWRSAASLDCRLEIMGIQGLRSFVRELPHSEDAAVAFLLRELKVPAAMWEPMLLSMIYTVPGWFAWTRYQAKERVAGQAGQNDFVGLLAMRLAYEAALARATNFSVDWSGYELNAGKARTSFAIAPEQNRDALIRHVLLRASEIAYRDQLLSTMRSASHAMQGDATQQSQQQKLAQMVFCIDVRSERMRRNVEHASKRVETFGFAGFFGLPIEYVAMGETEGTSQVPVLLKPQIKVHEGVCCAATSGCQSDDATIHALQKRTQIRTFRSLWKSFQTSAATCFSFVETTGLLYASKLLRRNLGLFPNAHNVSRFDGVEGHLADQLGPSLSGLIDQGVDETKKTDLAESMLRNLGLTGNFSQFVVICGHGSETENNPLRAGLDCGACGGHSGEANARFAAKLLNHPAVRAGLAQRGIMIPESTYFVAALHNTTTDAIDYFDVQSIPASLQTDFKELSDITKEASELNRRERLPSLGTSTLSDPKRRSLDWSEVRPEWGLAGNAAFIVAPRESTASLKLDGRTFMHSYVWQRDTEFKTLELIMTAPMVVTNWINLQYYASTVDNPHFGSGTKTVHNVVGKFGILSGNGGDLMTGLPWQSLHDGTNYQHEPLRLQVLIDAPRTAIRGIIDKHANVENLICNGWLHLVAIEEGNFYRFTPEGTWQALNIN